MSIIKKIFGDDNTRFISSVAPLVAKVNSLESDFGALSDADFPVKTLEFKARLLKGESLDDILPEAFALTREAAKRTLGFRHYDVQMIGGIALHRGNIAEMRTGEGKTLVATLPVYLNALAGEGVHVITVNDYLARRDAAWMGQIYAFMGLSIGVINSQNTSFVYDKNHSIPEEEKENESFKVAYEFLRPSSRKESYACDITYGTNNEYGFDYLKDNLAGSMDQVMQRKHHYAIVDEIDSILIDEARTPLIISSETGDSEDLYKTFANIARQLKRDEDYGVDEKLKATTLTDNGITKAEKLLGTENIYTEKGIKYVHHLETAVRAEALFLRDKDYVVREGEVVIVDPFTGRMQPGRRWSEGLHQAIEAKEGVNIQKESRAVASITFQNYFRFYTKLSGMTGTAKTSEEEFQKVYNLSVIQVPTNKSISRIDHNDFIFQNEKGKFTAVAKKVKELHAKGQPVLIGTVSIERNELLSSYLHQEGVPHTMLNAKNHESEGEIIAGAGKKGSVVLATNMAGRGIDIKLGGITAREEESKEIRDLGGLFVIGTERHEARRIDNQLRGRAGRQGDPGETQFYVSMEDDLMRVFGSEGIKNLMIKLGVPEDQPIQNRMISKSLENAQAKIEGFNFDARKYTLEYDDVMNYQRKAIYSRRRKMLEGDKTAISELLSGFAMEFEDFGKAMDEKKKAAGEDAFLETARRIILYVTDILWTEHIESMEYMRSSVNLRAYGQREPLVEYKKEGLQMFKDMEASFKEQVMSLITTMDVSGAQGSQNVMATDVTPQKLILSAGEESTVTSTNDNSKNSEYAGVGRNDLCPCGSGKKFKKCHGA